MNRTCHHVSVCVFDSLRIRCALSSACLAVLVATVVGGVSACSRANAPRSSGPPIILVGIDTLRADHLGCYGHDRATSPNIDWLAGEGTLFEWAFVDGGNMVAESGLNQGFDVYQDRPRGGLEVIGPRVSQWLERHADEGFFLLVHTYDLHTPYDPPEPYRSMFTRGLAPSTPGSTTSTEYLTEVMIRCRRGESDVLTAEDIEFARARYDGGIRYVDHWVGSLLEQLGRPGLLGRAVVFVVSDHGEEFQEHGSVLHEKLYTPVTRIPLIIRPPGGMAGRRVSQIVQSIDLMPTILDMAGVTHTDGKLPGRSLTAMMRGEALESRPAFSESRFFGGRRVLADREIIRELEALGYLYDV